MTELRQEFRNIWVAYWESGWWPQATGVLLLACFLSGLGCPLPQNITIACWPFIIWNLGRAMWNMRG